MYEYIQFKPIRYHSQEVEISKNIVRAVTLHNGPIVDMTPGKAVLVSNIANHMTKNIGYSIADEEPVDLETLQSVKLLKIDSSFLSSVVNEVKELMIESAIGF